MKGYKRKPFTEEHKRKLSETKKGKLNHAYGKVAHNKGAKYPQNSGKNNYLWKEENYSYMTVHHWVQRHYGQPTTCEHCQTANLTGHQIHWANKTQKYLRNREDWLRLCAKCHKQYDKSMGVYIGGGKTQKQQ